MNALSENYKLLMSGRYKHITLESYKQMVWQLQA
jgi:hypothetical protein